MSDWWDGQLDSLQTIAKLFHHLTSAELGGNKDRPIYQEFRASRLQLRFAEDLITCIQFFISKEEELYEQDRTTTVRHGNLGNNLSDLDYRTIESVAPSAERKHREHFPAMHVMMIWQERWHQSHKWQVLDGSVPHNSFQTVHHDTEQLYEQPAPFLTFM